MGNPAPIPLHPRTDDGSLAFDDLVLVDRPAIIQVMDSLTPGDLRSLAVALYDGLIHAAAKGDWSEVQDVLMDSVAEHVALSKISDPDRAEAMARTHPFDAARYV